MSGSHVPRVTGALLSLATALAFAACGDSTGPDPDVTVTVSLTQLNGPDVYETAPGNLVIECSINLRAVASGSATWLDATLFFYAGPDRATPVDSVIIAAADIQDAWGAPEIAPGQLRESSWRVTASIPFGASIVHRYRTSGGRTGSTAVTFACGPPVPPGAAEPAINTITLQPAGEIEPGGTLTVQYTAVSEVGLWKTRVRLTGACTDERQIAEQFAHDAARTVTFPIPPTCALGAPLAVTVFTMDAAGQGATANAPQPLVVVDRTPPQAYADHLPTAASYVFAGDTLRPFIAGLDNHSVRALVWDVGGVRDSILGAGGQYIAIPVRAEWAGQKIQVRLWARDGSGLVSDTLVAPAESLFIYPSIDRPTTWTTLAGEEDAADVIFDQGRGVLYLMQYGASGSRVGVFSLATRQITERIPLPFLPEDMDVTVSGDSLVLALGYGRALGVIDLRQPSRTLTLIPLRSLDSTLGQRPYQVRIAANGKAYVGLGGTTTAATQLLEVDLGTGAERILTNAGRNGLIGGARLERSFDRSVLVLAQGLESYFQRYDVAADAFGPIRAPVNLGGPLRIDRTGARVSVSLDIYDADLVFQRRVTAPYGGLFVPGAALSPDGEYLYQAIGFGGVARTRVSDGALLDRSPTPFTASGYLRISPDGTMLVIMDSFVGTLKIAMMDLR